MFLLPNACLFCSILIKNHQSIGIAKLLGTIPPKKYDLSYKDHHVPSKGAILPGSYTKKKISHSQIPNFEENRRFWLGVKMCEPKYMFLFLRISCLFHESTSASPTSRTPALTIFSFWNLSQIS